MTTARTVSALVKVVHIVPAGIVLVLVSTSLLVLTSILMLALMPVSIPINLILDNLVLIISILVAYMPVLLISSALLISLASQGKVILLSDDMPLFRSTLEIGSSFLPIFS